MGEILKRKLVKREIDNPINLIDNKNNSEIDLEEIDIQITDPNVLEKLTPFAVFLLITNIQCEGNAKTYSVDFHTRNY